MSDVRTAPTEPGPLAGIKVVELGLWVAGPAIGCLLSDWGAEVIKIEPLVGDPQRKGEGFAAAGGPHLAFNPSFDVTNRGKRSIAVDLTTEEGREIVNSLIARADVVTGSMRLKALRKLGFDYETLSKKHPRLVYALLSGFGTVGPDKDTFGYDMGAIWSRGGVAHSLMVPGTSLPFQRGAMGDRTAGAMLAGGVAAALFARERTGKGQQVSISLFRWGTYMMSTDLSFVLAWGMPMDTARRETMASPTINCYKAGDDRWFWLCGLERDRHWPPLVAAVEQPEWLTDERYATPAGRAKNARALIAELDKIFAAKPRDEWIAIFERHDVWHAAVNTMPEVVEDRSFFPSGCAVEVPNDEGGTMFVNTPIDFSATPAGPRGMPPKLGEHTDQVLRELGRSDQDITRMREAKLVG
jgi:crotonobetainyl-CoA:carnitine CoA-transferase CaiB-like acyl-CoA transferase